MQLTLAARMPLDRHQARSWFDGQEQTDRKNGRVCDKRMLALPLELTAEQRAELVKDFAEQVTQGRASYFAAIHDRGEDACNPHCHLVIRDRYPESKKRVIGLSESGSTEKLRATWERVANTHLEQAASPGRIDRRSLEAQGIERDVGIHVGPKGPAMKQHKGLRPESQERDERQSNWQPYKTRKRRKTPYPNIDRGRTRAEANAEREARNSARTKLKPNPVDDADRPEPATRNAALTARAVEEKEPGAARHALAGQDIGVMSAEIAPLPREERSDPRTEDRERDAPASPGRAWSQARDQADEGVQLAGRPRGARWGPRQAGAIAGDGQDEAGERAVIEQEFAAKVAAARLCTPRSALGAVVQVLRQEQRSRLAAVQAKSAARRDVRAAEALARHYRRLAEMVARGVPVSAQRPSVEDIRQSIRAAIMRNGPG